MVSPLCWGYPFYNRERRIHEEAYQIFYQTGISLYCCHFFPIISVIYLSISMISGYRGEIVAEKQKNIQSALENLADKMNHVENLVYIIGRNDTMSEYVYRNLRREKNTWLDSYAVSKLLKDFCEGDSVEFMYLYDSVQDCMITSTEVMSDPERYFKYKYQPQDFTVEMWKEKLETSGQYAGYGTGMNALVAGSKKLVMEYCVEVPFDVNTDTGAYLVTVINLDSLLGDLISIAGTEGEVYLYHGKEQLIYSRGENKYAGLLSNSGEKQLQVLEKGLYGTVLQSQNHHWWLQVYLPEAVSENVTNSKSMLIWGLMVITIFVSVFVCMFLTYRNHRSISTILHHFTDAEASEEEKIQNTEAYTYQTINAHIEKMMDENKKIRYHLSKMETSRRYQILDKLIRNTYENREQMEAFLKTEESGLWMGRSVVLCLRYNSLYYRINISEDVSAKEFVNEKILKLIGEKTELFEVSSRETLCIIALQPEQTENDIQNMIAQLMVEIVYGYGIDLSIGAGSAVDSMLQLHDSYMQAREVLKYREVSGANVYLYSEMKRLKNVYYFSKEMEERFCNYIILGKSEDAKEVAGKIYSDNFENESLRLSEHAVCEIKRRFREAMTSLAEKFDISLEQSSSFGRLLENYDRVQGVKEWFGCIYESVDALVCEILLKNNRSSVKSGSAQKVMEYINAHYCDNMLSVKMIAAELGLHEDYISKLFKKEYGDNLSSVIEQRRIAKACELLKTTDQKVADIASAVGYNNVGIFRKAFKRITGTVPSEYSESCSFSKKTLPDDFTKNE